MATRVSPLLHRAVAAVQLDTCVSASLQAEVPQLHVPPAAAQQIIPLQVATLSPTPTEVQEQKLPEGVEQSKRPHEQSSLPWQHTTAPPIVAALHSRTLPTGGASSPQTQKPSIGMAHGVPELLSELSHAPRSAAATMSSTRRMVQYPATRFACSAARAMRWACASRKAASSGEKLSALGAEGAKAVDGPRM